RSYFDVALDDLLKGADKKKSFLSCELLVGGKVVSSRDHFFVPFKELRLPEPSISSEVTPARNGFRVTVTSDKFADAVYLSINDGEGSFSDNYFDMIPGKSIVVEYYPAAPLLLTEFRERLSIRSMVDAF